ncbi:MAG TPA: universal stress protein [Terracidiphilus sp.]|nr:universal stress protein [Terracidiphilus sp.]
MALISKILFPVDFSPASTAMAEYVHRAAAMMRAQVALIHVANLASHNALDLYARSLQEIWEEHQALMRQQLDTFLTAQFPPAECPRLLTAGDPAEEIVKAARKGSFDLIIMPTHSGVFRQMLLGSTTAKVLDSADCPVLTSKHAENTTPRPFDHREWLCAVGLSGNSEKVLRYAAQAASEAGAHLSILHAVQSEDPRLPISLNLEEAVQSAEMHEAVKRIHDLQQAAGTNFPARIAIGPVKRALLQAASQSDADALIIGRSSHAGSYGRLRDLTYAVIRDSPFPVLSV